ERVIHMRRAPVLLALTIAMSAATSAPAAEPPREIPMVRIHAQTTVAATPAAVWSAMTQGKTIVTWCPVWKNPANAKVAITKVGDVLDYTDEWGHGGRSVVTYLAKDRELRVAHEPNDGSYVCQSKLVLTPKGNTTVVDYWDQYSDESALHERTATMSKMESEATRILAVMKSAVEKPPR